MTLSIEYTHYLVYSRLFPAVAVLTIKIWGAMLPSPYGSTHHSQGLPVSHRQPLSPVLILLLAPCIVRRLLHNFAWVSNPHPFPHTWFPYPPYLRKNYPCCKSLNISTFTTIQYYTTENHCVD